MRNPYTAVLLSIITPGVGHVYAGEWQRGLFFFILTFAWPLIGLTGLSGTFAGVIAITAVNIGLRLYILIDSFQYTRRNQSKPWAGVNKWSVYAGLIIVNLACQASYPVYDILGAQSFRARAPSMQPTIKPGDVVVSALRRDRTARLDYGDIVTFHHGENQWIFRMVGKPGDQVYLQDDFLVINNRPLMHRLVRAFDDPDAGPLQEWQETMPNGRIIHIYRSATYGDSSTTHVRLVPPGAYLLLGDNRDNALDGRYEGTVPQDSITGVIRYTLYGRGLRRINIDLANQ